MHFLTSSLVEKARLASWWHLASQLPRRRWLSGGGIFYLIVLGHTGCSGVSDDSPTPEPSLEPTPTLEVTVEVGAPQLLPDVEPRSFALEYTVTVGNYSFGVAYMGTEAGLFRLDQTLDEGSSRLEVYAGETSQTPTLHIRHLARRAEGLLVLADEGLYYTQQGALFRSPLSEMLEPSSLNGLVSVGEGTQEQVYFAASEGLLRWQNDQLEWLTLPGLTPPLEQVAANLSTLWVVAAEGLAEVSLSTGEVRLLAEHIQQPTQLVMYDQQLFVASEQGLWERHSGAAWTLHTLSGSSPGIPVKQVAFDANGRVLALTEQGLFRLTLLTSEGPSLERLASPEQVHDASTLSINGIGDVWLGAGQQLIQLPLGTPIGFEAQISPIFAQQCAYCHADGSAAPKHDFTQYDEVMAMVDDILQRIYTGNMPSGGALPTEQLEVIVQWEDGGLMP